MLVSRVLFIIDAIILISYEILVFPQLTVRSRTL